MENQDLEVRVAELESQVESLRAQVSGILGRDPDVLIPLSQLEYAGSASCDPDISDPVPQGSLQDEFLEGSYDFA